MNEFEFGATPLDGLHHVRKIRRSDSRGFFNRFFDYDIFAEFGWPGPVVQMNHSLTRDAGTVRGLHFQHAPHAEWKYVNCLAGSVFDVAVDVRPNSPTFGQCYAAILSAQNGDGLLIPNGFAHGFQSLSGDCELIYLHSAPYTPLAEDGIDALDPDLAIDWPLAVVGRSARDVSLPRLFK